MVLLTGLIFDPDLPERFYEGSMYVEDGCEEEVEGIVMPLLADSHTHLADGFILDALPHRLEEAVVEPLGLKHQRLGKARGEEIEQAFLHGLGTLEREGVGVVCDFREGGRRGVELARRATELKQTFFPRLMILGRPTPLSSLEDVLEVADGIGLCSVQGMEKNAVEHIAQRCKENDGMFAFHHSEDRHEDMRPVMEAAPDFIVHAAHCTKTELQDLSAAGIGVVVCPVMNALFGSIPPMRTMLDAGLNVALGTDNAMSLKPSMFEAMSTAYMLSRLQRAPLIPQEVLDMAVSGAKKVLRHELPIALEGLQNPPLAVLRKPRGCSPRDAANVVVSRTREGDVLLRKDGDERWRTSRKC